MPAAKVILNVRIDPSLAETLDAESRRSGRTKTDIVVAGLTAELAKEANAVTTADPARTLNAILNEHNNGAWIVDDGAQDWDVADYLNANYEGDWLAQPVAAVENPAGNRVTVHEIKPDGYIGKRLLWIKRAE